jgi:hypothetical protein
MGDFEPLNFSELALTQFSGHISLVVSQILSNITGDLLRLLIFLLDTESPRDVDFWEKYINTKRDFPDTEFLHRDLLVDIDNLSDEEKLKLRTWANQKLSVSDIGSKFWTQINKWIDRSLILSLVGTVGALLNKSTTLKRHQTTLVCASSFFTITKFFTCFKIRSHKENRLASIALKNIVD